MAMDLRGDLPDILVGLAFQQGPGQPLGSVQRRGAILHRGAMRAKKFAQYINGLILDRGQVRLQDRRHPRQHFRVHRVGLDSCAAGLGKAAGLGEPAGLMFPKRFWMFTCTRNACVSTIQPLPLSAGVIADEHPFFA